MEKKCVKYLASKKIEFCITKDGFLYYDFTLWKRKRNYNKKLPENEYYFYGEYSTVESAVIRTKREFNIIEEK